ncbi:MAG TPA: kinase, partial [Actinomycetes bacterium]
MRKRDLESPYEQYDPDAPDRERMRPDRDRARLTEQARARLVEQREAAVLDDGPAAGGHWSTFDDAEERGPEPYPGWLVTELAAVDEDLGLLKTGKEADVYLLRR